jgi:hypothetical protein
MCVHAHTGIHGRHNRCEKPNIHDRHNRYERKLVSHVGMQHGTLQVIDDV